MTIDEERIWLRVKVPEADCTAVMEMTDPVVPENGLQASGDWVLAALEQRADGATRGPEPGRMRSLKSRTVGFRRARAVETAGLAARRVSIVA